MDKQRFNYPLSINGSKAMNSDFIKDLVDDVKDFEEGEKVPTKSFAIGYAAGAIIVALGMFALEGFIFAAVATLLGWPLSFLQGLGIATIMELLLVRFKNG
jgi:hypothetical protein